MKSSSILFSTAIIVGLTTGCSTYYESETSDVSETYSRTEKTVDMFNEVHMVDPEPNSELNSRLDVFQKAVVAVDRPIIFQDPVTKAKVDVDLPFFTPLYIFGQKSVNGKTYLSVGKSFRESSRLGFIEADNTVPWNHRVGYLPQYSSTRPNRIALYGSSEEAKASLDGDDVEPVAEYIVSPDRPRPEQPWLICDKKKLGNGKAAYKVYALGKTGETNNDGKDAYTTEQIEFLKTAVRQVDVCFIIDGTGSMTSAIENVKEGVSQIAKTLQNFKTQYDVDFKFGLIIYRDVCDGSKQYEFNDLNDLDSFLSKIASVEADGGGDEDERGFIAAWDAIQQTSWRSSSIRHSIVVGDARWHESGVNNPDSIGIENLVNIAQETRVHISVLAVEKDCLKTQLSSLVSRTQGEARLFENVDELALDLAKKLKDDMEDSKLNGIVFDELAAGQNVKKIAKNTGKSIEAIYDVVRVLKTQGVEFERFKSRLDAGEITVVDGWIIADENADELEVYLFRFEAENVKAMLGSFRQSECSFLDKYRDGMLLAISSRVQGAPNCVSRLDYSSSGLPFGPHSLLRYTEDDFRAMTETERAALFEELDAKIRKFDSYLNTDTRWNRLAKTPAGWIPEKAFP